MYNEYKMNDEKDRKAIAKGLSKLLADTYLLYIRTQNFHWNVTGPMFGTLHLMFEGQYTELATAVDSIAERIRALGFPAPGTYSEFTELANLREISGAMDAERMVELLGEAQETILNTIREMFSLVNISHDLPTSDLLTKRMQIHEKTAWILRSLLDGYKPIK